ncbi:MAG: cell division protein FtsL [Hydrogenothermus sp.]|nr:MAG: cell division protein FtsL [Hydrogenothermus sp.]
MIRVKELTIEARKDFSILKKQALFFLMILTISSLLILYNIKFVEVEKEIAQLTKSKEFMVYENMILKKEIAKLKDPKRINKIAKKKLHMKPVNMEKVKFIKY